MPAINTTYDRIGSADTNQRFIKRLLLTANGKHGVIDSEDLLPTLRSVLETIHAWFNYSFRNGSTPPPTPTVRMEVVDDTMWFLVTAPPDSLIRHVDLYFATQLDTVRQPACDFAVMRLDLQGDEYRRSPANRDGTPVRPTCDSGKYPLLRVRPGCRGLHRELEDALPVCRDGLRHRFRASP